MAPTLPMVDVIPAKVLVQRFGKHWNGLDKPIPGILWVVARLAFEKSVQAIERTGGAAATRSMSCYACHERITSYQRYRQSGSDNSWGIGIHSACIDPVRKWADEIEARNKQRVESPEAAQ